MLFDLLTEVLGGLKSVNVETEKTNIEVNQGGFSLKFKPKEALTEGKETKLIEEKKEDK